VWSLATAISVTPTSGVLAAVSTRTGATLCVLVAPLPRLPWRPRPQHHIAPALVDAHTVRAARLMLAPPALTASTSERPGTSDGAALATTLLPRSPELLEPNV
jgi:hypothetical protein